EILEKAGTIFADKDNLLFFHSNSFKGQAKEMVVINELLREILLPSKNRLSSFAQKIKEEIDNQEVWLKLDVNTNRIYVNESFPNGFGYINLTGLTTNINYATFDKLFSKQVLDFLIGEIKKEYPNY